MLKQVIDRLWTGGTSPNDSEIYARIHKELSSGEMDVGLWTKATAVSDGNSEKAKARYIEMRANVLRSERKQILEFAKHAQREQKAIERKNAEQEKRETELQSLASRHETIKRKLWVEFKSPEARKRKRQKQLRNTVIFAAASALIFHLSSDDGLAALIFIIGFFLWILSLATYGKYETEKELENIKRRINNLGGNV